VAAALGAPFISGAAVTERAAEEGIVALGRGRTSAPTQVVTVRRFWVLSAAGGASSPSTLFEHADDADFRQTLNSRDQDREGAL
jgi:hypothetical protein